MKIVNITAALLLMLGACTPATAWNVSTERDKMTDKALMWASVSNNGATLLVGCMNGQVQPRLTWTHRIGWGQLGISYRFDDGPVVPLFAMVSQSGETLWPWIADGAAATARLKAGKRLRVTIGQAFYDFDLSQGGAPLPRIAC